MGMVLFDKIDFDRRFYDFAVDFKSVLPMTKHFLLHTPIGNLGSLRKEMEKVFDNNNISFLNICCLRIIFPSILRRVDLPFLNELKLSLYEEESESSLTGTL